MSLNNFKQKALCLTSCNPWTSCRKHRPFHTAVFRRSFAHQARARIRNSLDDTKQSLENTSQQLSRQNISTASLTRRHTETTAAAPTQQTPDTAASVGWLLRIHVGAKKPSETFFFFFFTLPFSSSEASQNPSNTPLCPLAHFFPEYALLLREWLSSLAATLCARLCSSPFLLCFAPPTTTSYWATLLCVIGSKRTTQLVFQFFESSLRLASVFQWDVPRRFVTGCYWQHKSWMLGSKEWRIAVLTV